MPLRSERVQSAIRLSHPRVYSASSMASSKSSIVFDDIFSIQKIDPEGKKFDRGMLKHTSIHASLPIEVAQFLGFTPNPETMAWN